MPQHFEEHIFAEQLYESQNFKHCVDWQLATKHCRGKSVCGACNITTVSGIAVYVFYALSLIRKCKY